jgi:hypothetical protein
VTTPSLVAAVISSLFRLRARVQLPGDDQGHPSRIVASIVKLIRNRPLGCEMYNETMARRGYEDEMLTIVDGEEDICRDDRKVVLIPTRPWAGLRLTTKICNGITIHVVSEPALNTAIVISIRLGGRGRDHQ